MALGDRRAREGAATLGEARAQAAARTDARVAAAGLRAVLRPGPGSSLDPHAPGPRAPVAASPILQRVIQVRERGREKLRVMAGLGASWRPELTADQMTGDAELRRSIVGRSRPLSYVYRFVGWTGFVRDQADRAELYGEANGTDAGAGPAAEGGSGKLPCIDCG